MTLRVNSLGPRTLEIEIRDKLESRDYEQFVPLAEQRIQRHGKIGMVVHIANFDGWSPRALWEDLKFDAKHYHDFARVALIGADTADKRWLATLAKPFTGGEVRFFTEGRIDDARSWAQDLPN